MKIPQKLFETPKKSTRERALEKNQAGTTQVKHRVQLSGRKVLFYQGVFETFRKSQNEDSLG